MRLDGFGESSLGAVACGRSSQQLAELLGALGIAESRRFEQRQRIAHALQIGAAGHGAEGNRPADDARAGCAQAFDCGRMNVPTPRPLAELVDAFLVDGQDDDVR
jgi:hypothetical protein